MKLVGLISDTHIPTRAKKIPSKVFEVFQNVDFIVHGGDLVQLEVIDQLRRIAPVVAVYGNMDRGIVREKLHEMNNSKVYDWRIGVMHDPGALFGRGKMRKIAEENKFHVLVYGHTHRSSIKWENNTLFINPGSPTNPLPPLITKPTIARLKITTEKIEPQIISIKK